MIKTKPSFNIGKLCIFIIILLSVISFPSCKKSDKSPIPKTESIEDVPLEINSFTISVVTIREWTPQEGGIGMALLVPEEVTKEQILALARHLRAEHLSKGWIWIDIFDSIEAYQNRVDPDYPEEEYAKHWLVQITYNSQTGLDKIEWLAYGRNH